MRKNKLKVYPSGFLGSDIVTTTAPMDLEKQKERFFDLSAITNPDGHTANLEVTRLQSDLITTPTNYSHFDFRERVLKVASSAFGTHRFIDWVTAQRESPYYNEYHAKWIDETIEYIFANRPRQFSTFNWVALTQMTVGGGSQKDSAIVAEYRRTKGSLTILDVLEHWCRVKSGIDDIPSSLYVLFGGR